MKYRTYHFKNGMYFIPELLAFGYDKNEDYDRNHEISQSVINIDTDLYSNIKKEFIERRKVDIGSNTIKSLSLVPTTECYGRCTYCYAKKTRTNPQNYIDITVLDDTLNKLDHDLNRVIIYGGDPVVNTDKLEEIIKYFKDVENVCIVTGLLYDETKFKNLISILNRYDNATVCISIDPKVENYGRRYSKINDVYSFLIDRVRTLVNSVPEYRVGYRSTVSENKPEDIREFIDTLIEIHNNNVDSFSITFEFSHLGNNSINSNYAIQLFEIVREYHRKYNKPFISPIKRFVFNPITEPRKFCNFLGDCGQLYTEISIDQYGKIHGCNESPTGSVDLLVSNFPEIPENIKETRINIKDQCQNCDMLFLCGGFCYKHTNEDVECTWRRLAILEALYWSVGRLKKEYIQKAIDMNNEGIEINVSRN